MVNLYSLGWCNQLRIVGIDVGGTNTDATLISEDKRVLGMAKAATDHGDILAGTKAVLREILTYNEDNKAVSLHLSTTLSTNAIVEGRGEPTAVLTIPGPGINVTHLGFDFPIYSLTGYIDHRGRQVRDINKNKVIEVANQIKDNGTQSLAIVGKFSQRNNILEENVKDIIEKAGLQFRQITLGHQLSGKLNFPRRLISAYLNSSVANMQENFVNMVQKLMAANPIISQARILKADGGTMSLADSCIRPIETILSGPAASLMAAHALSRYTNDNIVVVDIGGTTTDIAVIVGGEALYQQNGAIINSYRTLVPALLTHSIGLGGDSEIHINNKGIFLGPKRAGKAIALGGLKLTPTDAAVALNLVELGDRQKAVDALQKISQTHYSCWERLAQAVMNSFTDQLSKAINEFYRKLENVPVYTVSEILAPPDIRPKAVVGLGAPAKVFIPLVAKKLGLPWEVLPYHAGANGIGAAASRPTVAISLYIDTEHELLVIPELGYREHIRRGILFDGKQARKVAFEQISKYAAKIGLQDYDDIQIVEEEAFNVVRGFHTVGHIFNIRVQIRPGVHQVVGEHHC